MLSKDFVGPRESCGEISTSKREVTARIDESCLPIRNLINIVSDKLAGRIWPERNVSPTFCDQVDSEFD